MTIEQLLAEVEHLDRIALAELKKKIELREGELVRQHRTDSTEAWELRLSQFIDAFWGDTPAKEQSAIAESLRIKKY